MVQPCLIYPHASYLVARRHKVKGGVSPATSSYGVDGNPMITHGTSPAAQTTLTGARALSALDNKTSSVLNQTASNRPGLIGRTVDVNTDTAAQTILTGIVSTQTQHISLLKTLLYLRFSTPCFKRRVLAVCGNPDRGALSALKLSTPAS